VHLAAQILDADGHDAVAAAALDLNRFHPPACSRKEMAPSEHCKGVALRPQPRRGRRAEADRPLVPFLRRSENRMHPARGASGGLDLRGGLAKAAFCLAISPITTRVVGPNLVGGRALRTAVGIIVIGILVIAIVVVAVVIPAAAA
jgi:hypothetical protein